MDQIQKTIFQIVYLEYSFMYLLLKLKGQWNEVKYYSPKVTFTKLIPLLKVTKNALYILHHLYRTAHVNSSRSKIWIKKNDVDSAKSGNSLQGIPVRNKTIVRNS